MPKHLDPLPEVELNQLIRDVHAGRVFIANKPDVVRCAFGTLLVFMDSKDMPDNVGAIYEYLDQAGPRSINDYPFFLSGRFVAVEDVPKIAAGLERIKQAIDKALEVQP